MKTDEFDKLFRDKLKDYQSPVDAQSTWMGVMEKMDRDRKGGGFYFLTGIFLLSFLMAGAVWYTTSEPVSENSAKTAAAVNLELSEDLSGNEKNSESISALLATPREESTMETTDHTISKSMDSGSEKEENLIEMQSEKTPFKRKQEELDTKSVAGSTNDAESFEEAKTGILEPGILSPENTEEIGFHRMSLIPAGNLMRYADFPLPAGREMPEIAKSENLRIWLMADFGGGATGKHLEPSTPMWSEYTDQRLDTEKPLEYLNGQVRVGFELNRNWYFTTGFSFTRINERFSIDRSHSEEALVPYVAEIHINHNGDSTFVYGTAIVNTQYSERIEHTNRYTLLDIPFTAAYQHHFGAWSIGLEAGILLNLKLNTEGRMLNSSGEVMEIEDSGIFGNHLGIGFTGGARFAYGLSPNTLLYLQPGLRFVDSPLSSENIQRQSYTLYGINAGLAFRLK